MAGMAGSPLRSVWEWDWRCGYPKG